MSLLEISAGNVSGPRPVIRSHLSQRKEAGVGESPMRNEGFVIHLGVNIPAAALGAEALNVDARLQPDLLGFVAVAAD